MTNATSYYYSKYREMEGMMITYVSRKHLISFMAAKHPKQERRIMAVEEMRMM